MPWVYLVIAGVLEVGWAIGLKWTDGFTRPLPSVLTASAIVASMLFLGLAVRTLPIGMAYAVWVGIGTVGTAVLGVLLYDEPLTVVRAGCLALLVASILGLKLTAP